MGINNRYGSGDGAAHEVGHNNGKDESSWFWPAQDRQASPASSATEASSQPHETNIYHLRASEAVPVRRALVAESNPLPRGILKLLLNQRGYDVQLVEDGEQALKTLRQKHVDIAFLDYDLSKIGGSQVASTIKRELGPENAPRMIAITPDLKDVLTSSGGTDDLDDILPFDLEPTTAAPREPSQIRLAPTRPAPSTPTPAPKETPVQTILPGTTRSEVRRQKTISQQGVRPAPPPQAQPVIASSGLSREIFEKLGYNFLIYPDDLDKYGHSKTAMRALKPERNYDGLLLNETMPIEKLATLWKEPYLFSLPLIDLTGRLSTFVDFDGTRIDLIESGQLDHMIHAFANRREQLHPDILNSTDHADQLIGRMFVADKPLLPRHDPADRAMVSYNVGLPTDFVLREAMALHQRGLLHQSFFERFHVCSSCDSHRLHVREECSQCRSADLREERYIHHFECAYEGPESDYKSGDKLICPKCQEELTHFGYDYDRPGSVIVCNTCSHSSNEPSVGFVCMDCGSHMDGEAAETRDVYSYALTPLALGFVEHGRSVIGGASQALRFTDLPFELVAALNRAMGDFETLNETFTLVNVVYRKEKEVSHAQGHRAFAASRDLFVENLRSILGDIGTVAAGQARDFILLPGIEADHARAEFAAVIDGAKQTLRYEIGPIATMYGPEVFA